MDNRIPPILKKYLEKNQKQHPEISFLSFESWLKEEEYSSKDWIVVARSIDSEYCTMNTTSCLMQGDKKAFKKLFQRADWEIDSYFGNPSKYIESEDEIFDDGLEVRRDGMIFTPFVFLRDFKGHFPARFEIIQHFLLYNNAYHSSMGNEWISISENGKLISLARHRREKDNEVIEVDVHLLKNYLAVKSACLIRYHDHKRRSASDISKIIKLGGETNSLTGDWYRYDLDLRTDIQYDNIKSTSRLFGKDVVVPYPQPESHGWMDRGKDKQYVDFIIGRDERGKLVLHSSEPEKLSNYFKDRGTPHTLTSVFFKREVLQKYYSEPACYEVTESSVSFLYQWGIDIDINPEGLVHAYLGDLGQRLPYEEQLHWRQYNVVGKGEMSESRFEADILNKWPDPKPEEVPVRFFKEAYKNLQKAANAKFDAPLFKELHKGDKHLFKTLRVPLNEEWRELDEQILALSKITNDSLNKNLLSTLTGKHINCKASNSSEKAGSLSLLRDLLLEWFKEDEVALLMEPFNIVQALRSSGSAHRKGSTFDKNVERFGLSRLSNEDKIKSLLLKMMGSFHEIEKRWKEGEYR